MRHTQNQKLAITQRGASLIVTASAGSGKTSVMIQRVVDCIRLEKVPIDELLVVTFTRAAAQEMKERIRKSLTEAVNRSASNAEETVFLQRQLQLLDSASISTIHHFCGGLLKRYYPLLNLDPDYTIPGEAETDALFDDCYRDVLEEVMARRDPRIMEVFRLYWSTTNDHVRRLVEQILIFCRSREEGLLWLKEKIEQLRNEAHAPRQSVWAAEMCRYLDLLYGKPLLRSIEALEREYAALREKDPKGVIKKKNDPDAEKTYVEWIISTGRLAVERLRKEDFFGAIEALDPMPEEIIKGARGQTANTFRTVLNMLKELSADHRYDEKAEREVMISIADRLEGFYLTASQVEEEFNRRKLHSGKLQFDDLERLTLRLLDIPEVCTDIRNTYRYVFVDEYQDVSQVQESIISRVSRPDNLFCVGDLKQSIYHFRNADPGIFIQRMQKAGEINTDAPQQKITLAENFRSHPGIIEAVNLLLAHEMRVDPQLSPYSDEDAMVAASARPPEEIPAVHFFAMEPVDGAEDKRQPGEARSQDENCDLFVAKEIIRLYGSPVWNGKKQCFCPLEYKDISILAGKWADLNQTAEVLRRYGIPVLLADNRPVFDRTETRVLVECLRWIDDPGQDVCLADVLHSDMVGLSAGEMASIRQLSPHEPLFYDACLRYCRIRDDGATAKLRAFFNMAEDWRRYAAEQPCHQLILRVLEETGYIHTVSGYTEGKARAESLRKLVVLARRLAESVSPSLYSFLRYADQMNDRSSDERARVSPDVEAVRMYTYHGSKGLEFPVVFMVHLDSAMAADRKEAGTLTLDGRMGAALMTDIEGKGMQSNLVLSSIMKYNERFAFAENLRLLYVAMTRAREKLYLVGKAPSKEDRKRISGEINYMSMTSGRANNMRLLSMLACRMPGGEALAAENTLEDPFSVKVTYPWHIQVQTQPLEEPEVPWREIREVVQTGVTATDTAAFRWRYPYKDEPSVPGTLAATSLLRSIYPEQDEAAAMRARPLQGYRKKKGDIKATDIGTWIHGIMERMRPGMQAEKVLAELIERGVLPPEALDTVDCGAIDRIMREPTMLEAAAAPGALREQPFILRIPACEADPDRFPSSETPVIVQGIIDLAYETENGWVLLDYKSNRVSTAEEMAFLLDYYAPQTRIYRTALEKITKKPVVKAGLALISAGKILWFNLPE